MAISTLPNKAGAKVGIPPILSTVTCCSPDRTLHKLDNSSKTLFKSSKNLSPFITDSVASLSPNFIEGVSTINSLV